MSMDRRRHSTIALCAGPSAASGRISSVRWPAPRIHRTGYSSTAVASRPTAAPGVEKGGLGSWYRPHQRRPQHQAPDEKGRPCVLLLTSGNVHDCKVAQRCIEAMPPSTELVADKGYDSQAMREWLDARCTEAVIPPRKTRKTQYNYDKAIYKQRNIIERMFCRFKDWRGIATRFDRNLKSFMAANDRSRRDRHLVAIMSPDPNDHQGLS